MLLPSKHPNKYSKIIKCVWYFLGLRKCKRCSDTWRFDGIAPSLCNLKYTVKIEDIGILLTSHLKFGNISLCKLLDSILVHGPLLMAKTIPCPGDWRQNPVGSSTLARMNRTVALPLPRWKSKTLANGLALLALSMEVKSQLLKVMLRSGSHNLPHLYVLKALQLGLLNWIVISDSNLESYIVGRLMGYTIFWEKLLIRSMFK